MKESPVTRAINEFDATVADARRRQRFLRGHRTTLNHYLAPLLAAKDAGWLRYTPSIYAGEYSQMFEINANMYDVDGFKHDALMAILEAYIDAEEVATEDSAADLTRIYTFTFPRNAEGVMVKVILSVQVKDDSATCQRVLREVKETLQKTEIYELVCSGDGA